LTSSTLHCTGRVSNSRSLDHKSDAITTTPPSCRRSCVYTFIDKDVSIRSVVSSDIRLLRSSKMRVFSFDRYTFHMKFPTGFTYRNLNGFAWFPCDSTARLLNYLTEAHACEQLVHSFRRRIGRESNSRHLESRSLFRQYILSVKLQLLARDYADRAIFYRKSVRPSVCPSVTRVDQSKTVEVRIMQYSPTSSLIPLVFAG